MHQGSKEWTLRLCLNAVKSARAFTQEHELPIGSGAVGVIIIRTIEYRKMILIEGA